jgi:hypothetical protein
MKLRFVARLGAPGCDFMIRTHWKTGPRINRGNQRAAARAENMREIKDIEGV